MPFTYSTDNANQIVILTSTGDQYASETTVKSKEAIEVLRKNRWNKLLVDVQRAIVKDTIMESYTFAESFEQLGVRSTDKIALVVDPNNKEETERHRFSETLAINRGFDIKLFFTISEATNWLIENKKETA